MKKLNTGLFCIELMLLLIAGPAIAQVEELQGHPDYATVYIRSPDNPLEFLNITVDGQTIGKTYRKNDYLNFRLAPGFHNFRTNDEYNNDSILMSLFDIEVKAGAVILLECYTEMGGIFTKIPKDPVLQEWENYCPGGDLTQAEGVTACIKPYRETSVGKLLKQGLGTTIPKSACYLSDNREAFLNSTLVEAEIDFITSEEFEYSQAAEQNTVEAYQAFMNVYPRSSHSNDAEQAIQRLQEEQSRLAYENTIKSMIERDAALPLQVRKDKYMVSLTNFLKQQKYAESLMYFHLLEDLNVELSPSFEFFWGEALINTGDTRGGIEKLYAYISSAGQEGQYYMKALELVSAAENQ